jgi:predicted Rossmann-fold nucleotide-binding protein
MLIGIIGRTVSVKQYDPSHDIYKLGFNVGRAVAAAGHSVMTGGSLKKRETSVKYSALLGASDVKGICVGLLPKSISSILGKYAQEIEISGAECYLHTQLSSKARSKLFEICDGIVCLPGRAGTMAESLAGLSAGKPVVCLDTAMYERIQSKKPQNSPYLRPSVEQALALIETLDVPLTNITSILPWMDAERARIVASLIKPKFWINS